MEHSVEFDLSREGSNLYIFFGGIATGIAMPPFEFYNSSKIMNENKIFIRDFSQSWYQLGIRGISTDINSTRDYILERINKLKPEKLFFVGNSMGGFAALLFASIVGKGEVIAFAPQTFISPLLRLKHQDFRWKKQIIKTYFRNIFKKKVLDLKPLLVCSGKSQKYSLFVSKQHRLDYIHALHLKDIPGVVVHEYETGGHEVVKMLRDKGKLAAIMSGEYVS